MDTLTSEDTFPAGPSGTPLRLSFTANAIREHFECDPAFAAAVDAMDDDTLARIGEIALLDDRLYETFHRILVDALTDAVGEAS